MLQVDCLVSEDPSRMREWFIQDKPPRDANLYCSSALYVYTYVNSKTLRSQWLQILLVVTVEQWYNHHSSGQYPTCLSIETGSIYWPQPDIHERLLFLDHFQTSSGLTSSQAKRLRREFDSSFPPVAGIKNNGATPYHPNMPSWYIA